MPVFSGGKWGDSPVFGTPGGTITWSIIEPGVEGVDDAFFTGGSNVTTDPADAFDYNVEALLTQAFERWSVHANIQFVQVVDGGEPVGEGTSADIRISFGEIDGLSGATLAFAFFPFDDPVSGDIHFDDSEGPFYDSADDFLAVAVHEIGHSIGLDHITTVTAIMNPTIGVGSFPLADDINGVERIYGEQDGTIAPLLLSDRVDADIEIAGRYDGLTVRGDARANAITGNSGDERLLGGRGDDVITGRGGDDVLVGARDEDTLSGGSGADVLRGGKADDLLNGDAGHDVMMGAAGDDLLYGGSGRDTMAGGTGDDTVFGGFAGDRLVGRSGDDELRGQNGLDDLSGGAGDDILVGGRGNDTLAGGSGVDIFLFAANAGNDVIRDFDAGTDRLDYSVHRGVDDFSDLALTAARGGVEVSDGAGNVVFLQNVALDDIGASDFLF